MQSLRDTLLESIRRGIGDRAEISGSESGMHLLLRLRDFPVSLVPELCDAAAVEGVGIHSARPYYLKPPRNAELIMGFGAMREGEIEQGVAVFVSVLDRFKKEAGSRRSPRRNIE